MKFLEHSNWGLKILALLLAIVIYYALKEDSSRAPDTHDHTLFKQH